jgi:hypothetical protein
MKSYTTHRRALLRGATAAAAILLCGFVWAQAPAPSSPNTSTPAPSAPKEDIRDIRGPQHLVSPWTLPGRIAAGALIVAASYAAWRWNRRRRSGNEPLPFEVALRRLDGTRPLIAAGTAREFSIEVSDAVRDYIEKRFGVKAPHRTTDEFLRDQLLGSDKRLAGYKDLLEAFLKLCDLAKFAGWNLSAEDMELMLQKARSFVLDTGESPPKLNSETPPRESTARDPYVQLPST